MKAEQKKKNWIVKAEREEKNILDVLEILKKDIEKNDNKKSDISISEENYLFKYLEESSAFKVAKCMYLLSQGICKETLSKLYSPITLEIAEEILKKNRDVFSKGSYKRDVNFFYRRSKILINEYVMQNGMKKYRIQFAFEMYKELQFKILNFEKTVKDDNKEQYLYKLIEEIIAINYLVNRIYDEIPDACREMKKHLQKLNYSKLNMLEVQYQELY